MKVLHGLSAVAELKRWEFYPLPTQGWVLHGLSAVAELKPRLLARHR